MKNQRTFRDMMIQSFLKWDEFWGYRPFPFRDMGYFSKYFNGYGVPGTPTMASPWDGLP